MKTPLILATAFAALLATHSATLAAVTVDENGWTVVTPSEDSRVIYVSSSEGLDANDGLSPETPKKTVAHAQNFLREGYPDHLLLKRGDTFTMPESGLNRFRNGRNADEPILISYYGTSGPRPVVEVKNYFVNHDGEQRSYQAFIGLEFYKPESDPDSDRFADVPTPTAFRLVGSGGDILIEDCRLRFATTVAQSYNGEYKNITFRRNIVTDTWSRNSSSGDTHTTGIYFAGLNGYTVEENFFDHCGWNEQIADANANMFAHNVYIQYSNKAGGIFRGNISARSSAHGAQLRSGGIAERNVFVLNAISANFGGVSSPTDPAVMEFDNVFRENVILNGRLMDPNNTGYPRTTAVWGFMVAYVGEVDVIDNIVANRRDSGSNQAFGTAELPASQNRIDNIVYKWHAAQDMTDPTWPHPDHDLGHYYDSVIGTDATGEAATIEYLNWQRERPIRTMPWEMTAYAAINYIREGFNKEPVEGYFTYPTLEDLEGGTWADWPKDEIGNVNTGAFLGWINVAAGDWIFLWGQERWYYLPEAFVQEGGAWTYIPR